MWKDLWIFYLLLIGVFAVGAPLTFFILKQVRWIREGLKPSPGLSPKETARGKIFARLSVVGWLLFILFLGLEIWSLAEGNGHWGNRARDLTLYYFRDGIAFGAAGIATVVLLIASFIKMRALPKDKVTRKTEKRIVFATRFFLILSVISVHVFYTFNDWSSDMSALMDGLLGFLGTLTALLLCHIALSNQVANLAAAAGKNRRKYFLKSACLSAWAVWIIAARLKPAGAESAG